MGRLLTPRTKDGNKPTLRAALEFAKLGWMFHALHDDAQAERSFQEALALASNAVGDKNALTCDAITGLVAVYEALGMPDRVAEYRARLKEGR